MCRKHWLSVRNRACVCMFSSASIVPPRKRLSRAVQASQTERAAPGVAMTLPLRCAVMGRLTLNVLLSFAQFEPEVAGERIRDKIAASKKKGLWMGGVAPLGYRLQDRKLYVDQDEAAIVRLIFDVYLELGSIRALQRELKRRNLRTRVRTLATAKTVGGVLLTNGPL
jgi:DNA invertase Pin-like site-specific DNA recombinase